LVCALVPDAEAPGRRDEIEQALGRRAAALGPTVPWAESWRSAARARDVHRLMAGGIVPASPLVLADDHLADLIVHSDPALAQDLARRRLAPLDELKPAARRRLRATLAAWLDHHGSVRQTAGALHVHPQTIRYRLAQLRELFGDQLDDPRARFELGLACLASREQD
jgi:DNA-binding PucR family transcriptional regulator